MADGRIIIDTELNTAEFEGGLKQLNALTVAAGTVIGNVLGAGIGKVKDFIGTAIQSGMEYDTAMSQVAATMGTTVDQITGLAQAASEMGATTKFTATEAAEGINILAMAGLKENDILAENAKGATILSTTLSLASAGAMDMASSATYLTGAVKGFGDEASNAQYYADLMAKGATLANTDVSGLGSALSDAAASASAYGQKADSVTLSLLRLAEQNVTGTAASTALAAAMKNLYTPLPKAKTALDELGVSAYNADGSTRDFNEVVDDLSAALAGYTDEEANAYKQRIFGIQGLDAYNKMTVTSSEKVAEFKEGLAGASDEFGGMGAAAGQAQTQLDNLEGDLTLLSSALDGLSRGIYNTFSGSLRDVVKYGTSAVSELTTALQTDGVGGMLRVAGELALSLIQGFVVQFPSLLQTGVDAAVSLVDGLSSGLAGNVTSFIGQALPMLMEFSGQLRANAGQLIDAGLNLIVQLAHGIANSIPTLIETVPTIVTNIAGIINDNAPKLLATAATVIATLASGLLSAIPTLVKNLPKIVSAIIAVFQAVNWLNLGSSILNAIRDGITSIGANLPAALKKIGSDMVQHFKSLDWENTGVAIIEFIAHGLSSIGSMIWTTLTGIADVAIAEFQSVDWLSLGKNLVLGIIDGITGLAGDAVSAITGLGSDILDGFKDFFGIHSPSSVMADQGEYMIQGLVNALQSMPQALAGILSKALSDVTKWGTNLAGKALSAAKTMLTNVVNQVKQLPSKIGTQLNNVIKNVTSWASTMVSKAKTAATQTLSNVVSQISQMPGKMGAQLNSVISKVTSWATSIISKSKDAASKMLSNVVSQISQMPGKVGTQLSSVLSKVSSWATSIISKSKDAGSQALSNVVSNVSQMPGKVGSQLSSVISKVTGWASSFTSKVKSAASSAVSGLVKQVSQMPGKVGSQLSKVLSKAASFGSSMKSKFTSIGKNAINGVISGIKGSVSKLYSSIKSALSGLVKKAKDALGIKSPSTVLRDEVGQWIPKGVAQGITDNIKSVISATAALTKGVATSLKDANGKKTGEDYAKSIVKGITSQKKYAKKSAAVVGEAIVSTAEKKLKNYQTTHDTTLAYEVGFWKKIVDSCKKGTQAYYDAYSNYSAALKDYNDGMAEAKADLLELEDEYAKNMLDVETNLVKEMNDLWDTYYDAVDQRSSELFKSLGGLFEGFESTTENTTSSMISNMNSQVEAMKQWQQSLNTLQARGLDSGLLDAIRELGPEASADVAVLTQMTDQELDEYVRLWKEKMELCNAQATAENKDLYDSTVKQIQQLKDDATEELKKYTEAFVSEVKELGTQAKKKLGALPKSFQSVGKQAINGLTTAIKNGKGSLSSVITDLMNSAVSAAKDALGIKSPSRVFRDKVGEQIVAGIGTGIEDEEPGLYRQMDELSDGLADRMKGVKWSQYLPDVTSAVQSQASSLQLSVGAVIRSEVDRFQQAIDHVSDKFSEALEKRPPVVIEAPVYLDGKQVGDASTGTVDRNMGRIDAMKRRGG